MITKEQIIEIIRDNKEAYGRVDENGIANDILKLLQADVISSFACLSDDNSCEKQCDACKFVENGLKQVNDL
jgi:hypothetical protein